MYININIVEINKNSNHLNQNCLTPLFLSTNNLASLSLTLKFKIIKMV